MIKFFGLLSKKKKVKPELTASIYVAALNNVINEGFVEIKDFINDNNNLEDKPNLTDEDITWFRNIIFLGNIQSLQLHFEEKEAAKIREFMLDEMYKDLEQSRRYPLFLDPQENVCKHFQNNLNTRLLEKDNHKPIIPCSWNN